MMSSAYGTIPSRFQTPIDYTVDTQLVDTVTTPVQDPTVPSVSAMLPYGPQQPSFLLNRRRVLELHYVLAFHPLPPQFTAGLVIRGPGVEGSWVRREQISSPLFKQVIKTFATISTCKSQSPKTIPFMFPELIGSKPKQ